MSDNETLVVAQIPVNRQLGLPGNLSVRAQKEPINIMVKKTPRKVHLNPSTSHANVQNEMNEMSDSSEKVQHFKSS